MNESPFVDRKWGSGTGQNGPWVVRYGRSTARLACRWANPLRWDSERFVGRVKAATETVVKKERARRNKAEFPKRVAAIAAPHVAAAARNVRTEDER